MWTTGLIPVPCNLQHISFAENAAPTSLQIPGSSFFVGISSFGISTSFCCRCKRNSLVS